MDATPQTPSRGTGSAAPPTNESPPKYVPQFSAATEMILKRINSGGVGTSSLSSFGITGTPPGYEDMRRSVLQGMKTTLNMEISTPVNASRGSTRGSASGNGASSNSGRGRPAKGKAKAGTKRKRVSKEESESTEDSTAMSGLGDDSESDDTSSITEFPRVTQSGRAVNKPAQFIPAISEGSARKRVLSKRSQDQALCKRCGRGHSPQSNMIVFCDGCNLGWHQMCHDPNVSDEEVQDEVSPWFCSDCAKKRGIKSVNVEQTKGVSWQGRSVEHKREYLSSLPHSQLVNLLLQATILHPNLPIYPLASNTTNIQAYVPQHPTTSTVQERKTNIYPQQPFPPSATAAAGLFSRSEANPNAPINFIRKIPSGPNTPTSSFTSSFPPSSQSQQPPQSQLHSHPPPQNATQYHPHSSSAPPTLPPQSHNNGNGNGNGNGQESRESTPASPPYPKAGNGLMAKLGPDDEDMEWLVDNEDFDAFSHNVYDYEGQVMGHGVGRKGA
ncbi:hypothetical protein B7494_g8210 [Chlorociboria aeruginascens]|nr:hypothetical protein B7494_g8210 [Chlorociboria aeruginascens]